MNHSIVLIVVVWGLGTVAWFIAMLIMAVRNREAIRNQFRMAGWDARSSDIAILIIAFAESAMWPFNLLALLNDDGNWRF